MSSSVIGGLALGGLKKLAGHVGPAILNHVKSKAKSAILGGIQKYATGKSQPASQKASQNITKATSGGIIKKPFVSAAKKMSRPAPAARRPPPAKSGTIMKRPPPRIMSRR